jgi:predicted O-methyltransferase YrrM
MPWHKATEISGWMSDQELEWLYNKAQEMETIVEIGSWKGRSTYALCAGCPGMVYSIDHFKGSASEIGAAHKEATERDLYPEFKQNMNGFENIIHVRFDSAKAARSFYPGEIDMVFIDGGHSYDEFMPDFKAWLPIAKKIICGHDRSQDGVPRVLNESGFHVEQEAGTIWSIKIRQGEK